MHWILFHVRNRKVWEIAAVADEVREQRVGNAVTYVRNQNINVTNLCVNACGFCGFSKKPVMTASIFTTNPKSRRRQPLQKCEKYPRSVQ